MIIPDMQIKAISFDWGDTLAANHSMPYRKSQERALLCLAGHINKAGGQIPDNWMNDSLNALLERWYWAIDPEQNPEHQEIDFQALLDGWIEAADCNFDQDQYDQALSATLEEFTNVVLPFVGARDCLQALKSAGFRIGILSHVAWPRRGCLAWFEHYGFADYIDFYSLSCDVGWIKPNPKHYQDCLNQAACNPDELLHVGDHPLRDISAAKAFGFHTCLKLTEGIYDEDALENCSPDYTVMHVKELPQLLAIH